MSGELLGGHHSPGFCLTVVKGPEAILAGAGEKILQAPGTNETAPGTKLCKASSCH